jgi:hypothetical protein
MFSLDSGPNLQTESAKYANGANFTDKRIGTFQSLGNRRFESEWVRSPTVLSGTITASGWEAGTITSPTARWFSDEFTEDFA